MKMTEKQTAIYDKIMTMANAHYTEAKAKRLGIDFRYTAPEVLPKIESDQVKSLAKAIVMSLVEGK
jgi:hypothetical protein